MLLTFLKAAVPLSKTITYSQRDDEYTVAHYPMVKRMTSNVERASNMKEFGEKIEAQGNAGACLMFGGLKAPLFDESRAGATDNAAPHEWIMFDFDKVDAEPSIDGALDAIEMYLPPACQGVDCLIQLSPSCYLPRTNKLSCHVFMRLDRPHKAEHLKEFLVWVNFSNPLLEQQIRLTDSASALTMRLDRCVTDASRLIYIAPPRCVGFTPEPKEVLAHIMGEPTLTLPEFTPISREQQSDKVNDLRQELGMERRSFRSIKVRGTDVLDTAEPGVISDVRASGDKHIRFNLNGGDSLAYWIDLQQPDIIGNFKGEPFLLTKTVDEGFYKSLVKASKATSSTVALPDGTEVLAFYATNRNSALYVGVYDRAKDKLRVDKSTESAAYAWLKQNGVPITPSFPHYDLVHDISSNIRYEEGYPVINMYERTDLLKQFGGSERLTQLPLTMSLLDQHCPVIMTFLRSATGDKRSAEGFINWLAYIFQYRIKTGTAWLLHGTEGTGKGKFIEHVCKPLFGTNSVAQVMMGSIDKDFNNLLEGKLLVNVDEAEMSRTRDKDESMAKLRNWITEPMIVINDKNVSHREVPSFINFIITANSHRPIRVPAGDRRFHIAARQEQRLYPTANEHAILVQGEELPMFAKLLGELIVDEAWVRQPEMNEQKLRLFESTHNVLDSVGMAINEGDASFFFEARPPDGVLAVGAHNSLLPIRQYDDLLRAMVDGTLNVLKHEDLYILFSVVVNDTRMFPDNQTVQRKLFNRYGLLPGDRKTLPCKRSGREQYGVPAPNWEPVPEYLLEVVNLKPENTDANVVPIRKA